MNSGVPNLAIRHALASAGMFATLGGSLPALETSGDPDSDVVAAIAAQERAGLEALTDGGRRYRDPVSVLVDGLDGIEVRATAEGAARGRAARSKSQPPPIARALPTWRGPILVDGWRATATLTDLPVKQVLVGPYTLGRRVAPGTLGRDHVTRALAEALAQEIRALADAGCALIEIVEDAATLIGEDPAERHLFRAAQRRLLAEMDGVHCSLSIRGGNADTAGAATILDAPYSSYLFDLCAGPDNWRLIVDVPGDRGVIVGAADARTADNDTLEILAFAIGYAASTRERGHARVGLATSGDMAALPPAAAVAKMERIGEAARLYASDPGALAAAIDPRSVDIRGAALGRTARSAARDRG